MRNTESINNNTKIINTDTAEKADLKRLLIYLGLCFGMTWIWFFAVNPKFTHWNDLSRYMASFISLGMLFPVISHVLTRLITKEGFKMYGKDSAMFGISFKDRKWIYFLLAILLPCLITELGNLFAILFCRQMFDPGYPKELDVDYRIFFLQPLAAIFTGVVGSFAAFGEEGGWRAYMMPKLLKLFGGKKALPLIIGGIIWGLWHAPLTCIGHNFGTDYPGFPFLGILVMCAFCILMGVILTFLTELSGSVWPAAIMHAVTNAHPSVLIGFMNDTGVDPLKALCVNWGGTMIALIAVVIVCIFIWRKNKKNNIDEIS
ncbi:MAG: CPBP family intramembrane metalloprotease [Lachnospiraceae bacterium]|nr:CPBP family intramembrane metalloprotease [Lachnospiraceae bacterium]